MYSPNFKPQWTFTLGRKGVIIALSFHHFDRLFLIIQNTYSRDQGPAVYRFSFFQNKVLCLQ